MKNSIRRRAFALVATLFILAAPVSAAHAVGGSIAGSNSGSAVSPRIICGYPDNPNGTCSWWANGATCSQIGQTNAPLWQKMACLGAGYGKK